MYKILIVDDEIKIREMIKKYAALENHKIIEANNGLEAIDIVKNQKIDIIVMDIMMPELDGFSSVKEIRKFSNIPVIMLSARGEEYDKILGFELGIDDYMVKPFSPKELLMRINAIMRRNSSISSHDEYIFENLRINFTARKVLINNNELLLSPKECDLLFYMVKNRNIALSRDQLISEIWGYDFYGDERTLDTHIKLLRKSLDNYSNLIVTLRNVGYRFEGK